MIRLVKLSLPASVLIIAGCAQAPVDYGMLEAKVAEAKSGDFGSCYTNINSAAVTLEAAEASLAEIKAYPDYTSQYVVDDAVKMVEKAVADRNAAERDCNIRTAALEAEMPGIKSTLEDHETRLKKLEKVREIVRGVTFVTGSAKLTQQARGVLDIIANRLQRSPLAVEIAGHASSTGTPERNMTLSQARAESVMKYLVMRGVDAKMLTAKGYGVTQPIADNSTRDGRTANQRVELRFSE